jgi:hypothetical protein
VLSPTIGVGVVFTVTMRVATQPVAVTLNEITTVPAVRPATTPGDVGTVAISVSLLAHVPVAVLASVVVLPSQTAAVPVIAGAAAFTLTAIVLKQPSLTR